MLIHAKSRFVSNMPCSQKMGTLANQEGNILNALKDSQQKLASAILGGNTSVRGLLETLGNQEKAHVTQEHVLTRQHLVTQISSLAERQSRQVEYERFIASLHFPEINLRQDTVSDAHKATFEWILDRSPYEVRQWSNFAEWAQSDEQLSWILGKPGSGKSTLMNFLASDPRVSSILNGDSGKNNVLMLSFFFWEAGVDLQKDQIGLLRSLTWQLFQLLDPTIALELYMRGVRPKYPSPIAWTTKQLLPLLSSLIGNIPQQIFFFLDGHDEFKDVEDEADAIFDVISSLGQEKNVKICISSRPAISLEALYNDCPKLRLQDLTYSDVAQYTEDKLTEASRTYPRLNSAPDTLSEIVGKVVLKAEGVFLWVRLAVQSLVRGIRLEDEWTMLEARLEQMPTGIFDLYSHIWKRLEADSQLHAKEAAVYLQLVKRFGSLSILEIAIASSPETQDVYLKDIDSLTIDQLGTGIDLDRVRRRLNSLCGGFLDLHETSGEFDFDMQQVEDSWSRIVDPNIAQQHPGIFRRLSELRRNHYRIKVRFMHRTALEYLRSDIGARIVEGNILSAMELTTRLYRCQLILFMLTTVDFLPGYVVDTAKCQSMLTYDELVQREAGCEKVMSLFRTNLQSVRVYWAFYEGTDDIDYATSFISVLGATPVAWLQHKLSHAGLIGNRDYLTNMLREVASCHLYFGDHRILCSRLLLQAGADPNAMILGPHRNDSSIDMTIWQYILLQIVHGGQSSLEDEQLVSAYVRANADLNVSAKLLLFRNLVGRELSTRLGHAKQGFLAYEEATLHRLTHSTNKFNSLLAEVDLSLLPRRPVFFSPQEGWFVLSTDFLRSSSLAPITRGRWRQRDNDYRFLDIYLQHETLVQCIEKAIVPYEVFSNDNDAFRAAGWTDGDIQDLGIALELLQQTHDGRIRRLTPAQQGGSV